ncbi:MAG: CxxxxCH/CxxCH domain-containing protein [Deltaproteobacteria bacterium]|nr:CxxxxCH/CxxCH domain-containing protein [Deltaproteobacteria bacterium]MCW8892975.1 CxxxxCH/CxxCH domain-containing protein [Deltaproteobacteria bacterium]
MRDKNIFQMLLILISAALISACGSSGGDSPFVTDSDTSNLYGGVVVDPYIINAILQEVDADGITILQRTSSASDSQGHFQFPQALKEGSTIEIKVGSRGDHVGASNQVILRRKVLSSDSGDLIVSPLTTLVANGSSEEDVVSLLRSIGLTGFNASDIYVDPMAGLVDRTTRPSTSTLQNIQAAIAIANFLEVFDNPLVTATDFSTAENFAALSAMLDACQQTLNPTIFDEIVSQLASDSNVSNLTLGDMINAAVVQNRSYIALARTQLSNDGQLEPTAIVDQAILVYDNMVAEAKNQNLSGQQLNGAALYADNCALCHNALANTEKPDSTATSIQNAIDNNFGGMGSLNGLTTAEVQAIVDALPGAVLVDPSLPPDGPDLYASNCSGCHDVLANTEKPGSTTTAIQGAIDSNLGGMSYLGSLTAEEIQAIADSLPAAPVVDPGLPPDGPALYTSECAGCHGPLATTNKPGRTATAVQDAIDNNIGSMGYLSSLTAEEVQAIADSLPIDGGPGGPDYSDCTSCHAQPPNGTSSPNIDGAHSAHKLISSIANDCSICHQDATHDGTLKVAIAASYDASSGMATGNQDGTCSSISCHGGQITPVWGRETLDLTSDCTSCHSYRSAEYNSYSSRRHSTHSRYSCTVCHNSSRMDDHIGDLNTETFEVTPASTVGGSGTSVGNYNGTSCSSIACHGREDW